MLAKYWRLRGKWDGDQTLTYNNAAAISIRMTPWKIASGNLSYGTTITEDLGFGSGETIADEVEVEGTVIDNTSNLYWGIKGYLAVTADVTSTDGVFHLSMEESDDNSTWPSDQSDFSFHHHTKPVITLVLSTTAVDQTAGINFDIGGEF